MADRVFTNRRLSPDRNTLEPHQQRQWAAIKQHYADDPEANFYPDNEPLTGVELWDVVDEKKVRYEVWLYASDSGSVFVAGKSKRIGAVVQFGLECDDAKVQKFLLAALEQTPDKSPSLVMLQRGSR